MDITMETALLSASFFNYKEKRMYFSIFSDGVTTSRWIFRQLLLKKMDITMESAQLSGSFPNYKEKRIFFYFFQMDTPHPGGYLPTIIKENRHCRKLAQLSGSFL